MTTQMKKFGIISLMFCFCILFSLNALAADPQTNPTPVASDNQPKSGEGTASVPPQPAPPQPPTPTQPEPVRNVFQSGITPIQGETPTGETVEIQTVLEGITINSSGARAIINGEVYKEGETKGGINIIQIRKKEVDILINQAVKRRLSMLPGETKDLPMDPIEDPSMTSDNPEGVAQTNDEPYKEPSYV